MRQGREGKAANAGVWSSSDPQGNSRGQSSPSPAPGVRLLGCAHASLTWPLAGRCWGGHSSISGTFWPAVGSGQQDEPLGKEVQTRHLESRLWLHWKGYRDPPLQPLGCLAGSSPALGSYSGRHVLCRLRPALPPFVTSPPSQAAGKAGALGSREGSVCPHNKWLQRQAPPADISRSGGLSPPDAPPFPALRGRNCFLTKLGSPEVGSLRSLTSSLSVFPETTFPINCSYSIPCLRSTSGEPKRRRRATGRRVGQGRGGAFLEKSR